MTPLNGPQFMAPHARMAAIDPGDAQAARIDNFCEPETGEADSPPDTATDRPSTISEVAHDFGITLRALRFYEAKRLLVPRRRGATRLYRRNDRERLAIILTGRRLGFTLAEIGLLLGRPNGKGLHLTREQCVMQINLLEQQKRGIEIAIAELRRICTSFYRERLDEADEHPR
jgi:DNA-binding transcriptional MerR regulator